MVQRYNIFLAVYEMFVEIFVVIMVKVKMVKIDFGNTVIAHYNINKYIFIYIIVDGFSVRFRF